MLFTPDLNVYPADQLVRSGTIADGEIMSTSSSYGGPAKTFKVTGIRVTFYPKDGAWYCGHATVSGPALKKNGEPGKVDLNRFFSLEEEGAPEWVREAVRHLQPMVPAPSMQAEPLTLD